MLESLLLKKNSDSSNCIFLDILSLLSTMFTTKINMVGDYQMTYIIGH